MSKLIKVDATGETITFTKTTADTGGAYVEMICTLAKNAAPPPNHIHTMQTEKFTAAAGALGIYIGKDRKVLQPGETFLMPVNTVHGFYCAGEEDISFNAVISPALDIEWFLTEMFAAMNRGSNAKPSIWEAAYILSEVKGQYYLANIAMFVQKHVFPGMAAVGKRLGLVSKVKPKNSV